MKCFAEVENFKFFNFEGGRFVKFEEQKEGDEPYNAYCIAHVNKDEMNNKFYFENEEMVEIE